jgi:hypothetical protein
MRGAIPPLPQYAFMAWCLVKTQGQLHLYFTIFTLLNECGTADSDTVCSKHRIVCVCHRRRDAGQVRFMRLPLISADNQHSSNAPCSPLTVPEVCRVPSRTRLRLGTWLDSKFPKEGINHVNI